MDNEERARRRAPIIINQFGRRYAATPLIGPRWSFAIATVWAAERERERERRAVVLLLLSVPRGAQGKLFRLDCLPR